MAPDDDELLDLIAPLDPTRTERPPAPGSDRYHSILEAAMHADLDTPAPHVEAPITPAQHGWRRTSRLVTASAAAALVAFGGFVILQSNDSPTAEAAVSSAADTMEDITSLEGELTVTVPGVSEGTTRIRVNGADVQLTTEAGYADGHAEASTFTVVDGIGYETIDGQTTTRPVGPNDGLAPFGPSSAAVISAALEGSDVTERGDESVDGVTTTRYDIELTETSIAALSALTPNELAWFELEHPHDVTSLSVWIADGLIRQVEIAQRDQVSRTRFFNFGSDITITAPPGPYVPAEE